MGEITLRPYELSDIDEFLEWANDEEVIRLIKQIESLHLKRRCIVLFQGNCDAPSMLPSHMLGWSSDWVHSIRAGFRYI
ncbi:hypothetical protein COLO4_21502 [Corchorus olitorius]|uniref:N-acetyltransferase domain-containing protein n=1 Tax=Corchorus olitorius TaxID=93759 RepID=A0A1R3ISW1_9ROSI|nr:hypothetical protein COLO4_21502 [Corchorus olitorius]